MSQVTFSTSNYNPLKRHAEEDLFITAATLTISREISVLSKRQCLQDSNTRIRNNTPTPDQSMSASPIDLTIQIASPFFNENFDPQSFISPSKASDEKKCPHAAIKKPTPIRIPATNLQFASDLQSSFLDRMATAFKETRRNSI